MIKLQATEDFSLARFNEIKELERHNKDEKGMIYKDDVFKCEKELADYLCGNNSLNRAVVKILEIEEPKAKIEFHEEQLEPKTEFKKTSKKGKKNKK